MLKPEHLQEWIASAVDPALTSLNVISLEGQAAYDPLFYSDELSRTNTGRLASGILNKYAFLEAGGWWCSGIDPLNDYNPMLWGCFKADRPRLDFEKGKPVKYEHPPKTETRAFLLAVPDHIWQKVSERYNIPIGDEDRQRGFWAWVWRCNVPLTYVEGAKKAGCLLTQGFAAIALPGHTGGYRSIKDEFGDKTEYELIPDLKHFATLGREIFICFDRDEKPKTRRAVSKSIKTLGHLFSQRGCKVRVVTWDAPYKAVDDFIVALGAEAFQAVHEAAPTLEIWNIKTSSQLTYTPALELNQRYLGALPIPHEAKLVCIKAPKGTGKTEALNPLVQEAIANGQPVLVIGHRIQLVQAISHRVGIPYITETRESELGKTLGYGLCADSLHPQSQARFNASFWDEALVIIDEAEQVIWHLLNSTTCQKQRVPILHSLKELLTKVLADGTGRVILSDADLSDLSVDFIKGLAGVPYLIPWVCVNNWKPETGWTVYNYEQDEPTAWLATLEAEIEAGGKPFIVTSSQKVSSRWGTLNLESHLNQRFPGKKILRIDSESIAEIGHPALGCITKLNEVLPQYDMVVCSPSIETGVSIDVKGHFTSVWGCFHGVTPTYSALQALARVREPVDRHIWVKIYGIGRVGNGSTSYKSILASQKKVARANIRLLQEAAFEDIDIDFDPVALRTWATMGARINTGMNAYRQHVIEGLITEGHKVINVDADESPELDALGSELTSCRDRQHRIDCEATATAENLTHSEYKIIKDKRAKTPAERRAERKHEVKLRYTEDIDIDAELIAKDDAGWHPKIRLHYFLTIGRPHLKARDTQKLKTLTENSYPEVWMPDLNKTQLSVKVAMLENLAVLDLTNPDVEYRGTDDQLARLAEWCKAKAWDIKAGIGVGISEADTPIAIAQKLLGKLGMKLKCVGRFGSRDNRQRVYKFFAPEDGRWQIFEAWLRRDGELAAMAA